MSPEAAHAEHFATPEQEKHAATLGMWLFLASEVLLFAGLFCAYTVYRVNFPETFREGSHHLNVFYGTLNTLILITSSLTVALSVHAAKHSKSRLCALLLLVSLVLALAFLGVKALEYKEHFDEGALPGRYFSMHDFSLPGASLFFTLYFFMTGLHAIHVIAGMGVLSWVGLRAARNEFSGGYHTPVELGGMYWHLVDLIWIFLYPLLYLVS